MRILIVGEAWGDKERQHRHAFVGPSGRELARLLAEATLAPPVPQRYSTERDMIAHWAALHAAGVGVANVFDAQPPQNEILTFFGPTGDRALPGYRVGSRVGYILPEHMHHVERLWALVHSARPNLVVALGNSACWALLGTTGITELRGTPPISPRLGVKVVPAFHPAASLRQWSARPIVVADLHKARREAERPDIVRTPRFITAHNERTGERITLAEIAAWLRRPATKYAIDIETGYILFTEAERKRMSSQQLQILSTQIAMIGIARSADEALVIPFMSRSMPNLTYWPNPHDEVEAWRLARSALRTSTPKVFQNGVFDIGVFLRAGIVPRACTDDTMLRHHAAYPEMRKGLGFLASLYLDEIAWKGWSGAGETMKKDD